MTVAEIGKRLESAGRLRCKPICVSGAEEVPQGAEIMGKIDRCIPRAIMAISLMKAPSGYLGEKALGGCCPGGQGWFGYIPFPVKLKHFISTGERTFMGGAAEYLKKSPETVDQSMASVGIIRPPARYTLVQRTEDVEGMSPGARSVICFGDAEQVRNLAALHHFGSSDTFGSCLMPWGPTCATLVTYPAGLASKAPKDAVFVGPTDPTGNVWFPRDYMAIAMSLATARKMCEDMDESFIMKRPKVAYPEKREL